MTAAPTEARTIMLSCETVIVSSVAEPGHVLPELDQKAAVRILVAFEGVEAERVTDRRGPDRTTGKLDLDRQRCFAIRVAPETIGAVEERRRIEACGKQAGVGRV